VGVPRERAGRRGHLWLAFWGRSQELKPLTDAVYTWSHLNLCSALGPVCVCVCVCVEENILMCGGYSSNPLPLSQSQEVIK
jgi:hypothetical protein